jgi:hypothetical protein
MKSVLLSNAGNGVTGSAVNVDRNGSVIVDGANFDCDLLVQVQQPQTGGWVTLATLSQPDILQLNFYDPGHSPRAGREEFTLRAVTQNGSGSTDVSAIILG